MPPPVNTAGDEGSGPDSSRPTSSPRQPGSPARRGAASADWSRDPRDGNPTSAASRRPRARPSPVTREARGGPGETRRKGASSRHSFQSSGPPRPPSPPSWVRPREASAQYHGDRKEAPQSRRRTRSRARGTIELGKGSERLPQGRPGRGAAPRWRLPRGSGVEAWRAKRRGRKGARKMPGLQLSSATRQRRRRKKTETASQALSAR